MPLKLAIVVHGRFHAFDLARELIRQGVDVTLLTNYPKRIAGQFGVSIGRVRNFLAHGLAVKIINLLGGSGGRVRLEAILHRSFSRWAARTLGGLKMDAVHSFSGVSEEIFQRFRPGNPVRSLVRGSAHIRTQARLLAEEQHRCGVAIQGPSEWRIAREMREYQLADLVIVLSSFAARSFLEEQFPEERLRILRLGSDTSRFRPDPGVIQARCHRIVSGEPLRILTVGSFTYQKGMHDLARVSERLRGRFKFRFVGDYPAETRALRRRCGNRIEFVARQPQFALPRQYRDGDLFVFPTIEDGYAVVLAQALASGLPVLTTPNCAGPDLIDQGKNGWVLPIRSPEAFIDCLEWCDARRHEVARMVYNTAQNYQPRDWAQVACDLQAIYSDALRNEEASRECRVRT